MLLTVQLNINMAPFQHTSCKNNIQAVKTKISPFMFRKMLERLIHTGKTSEREILELAAPTI
jgi:hypothetical protein